MEAQIAGNTKDCKKLRNQIDHLEKSDEMVSSQVSQEKQPRGSGWVTGTVRLGEPALKPETGCTPLLCTTDPVFSSTGLLSNTQKPKHMLSTPTSSLSLIHYRN